MGRFVPGKTFNGTARIACQKHLDIEFGHGARELLFKVVTIRHIFVDFHPRVQIVAAFQQSSGYAATARQPRLHGAHLDFGLVVVVGHAVVNVVVVQASAYGSVSSFSCAPLSDFRWTGCAATLLIWITASASQPPPGAAWALTIMPLAWPSMSAL